MMRTRRWSGREVERLLRNGVDPPGGDARLLDRYFVDRDESAFEAIVDRHGPLVLSLCRRALREPADVDDAFQATFLVLARRGAGLRDGRALSSWLYGVARRVAARARADALKRRSREGDAEGLDQAVGKPMEPVDDSRELLEQELARLPDRYRIPLILCYLEGRSTEQAATELGWPVGTVRSRMARARDVLRDRLSRRGVDASACLVAFRAEVASSVVPPSLVAASAACLGRSVSSVSNLATGVISTMTPSPWKLIGFLGASVGLTAGAIAASSALDSPAKPPIARAEIKAEDDEGPGEKTVEARLNALEQKLDKLTEMTANVAAPSARPTDPADPAPIQGVLTGRIDEPPAAPSPYDAKGLREIEAQLLNAHYRYEGFRELPEASRNDVSRIPMVLALEPVRILTARLRDMLDESEKERATAEEGARNLSKRGEAVKRKLASSIELTAQVETQVEQSSEFSLEQADEWIHKARHRNAAERNQHQLFYQLYNARRRQTSAEDEVVNYEREEKRQMGLIAEHRQRSEAIQKLLDWIQKNFKGARLTIDE